MILLSYTHTLCVSLCDIDVTYYVTDNLYRIFNVDNVNRLYDNIKARVFIKIKVIKKYILKFF